MLQQLAFQFLFWHASVVTTQLQPLTYKLRIIHGKAQYRKLKKSFDRGSLKSTRRNLYDIAYMPEISLCLILILVEAKSSQ